MNYEGLTGCDENIRCFLGLRPYQSQTKDGRLAVYFDVSWGLNDINRLRFSTWRHCIAYGKCAETILNYKSGSYLALKGFIVTNPVYDTSGEVSRNTLGKIITKEYLIVTGIYLLNRDKSKQEKQLSLVEAECN